MALLDTIVAHKRAEVHARITALPLAALRDRPLHAAPRRGFRAAVAAAAESGLDVLVEVHSEAELRWALGAGATLVGINNRDLSTFTVALETTERLVGLVPRGVLLVAESGIRAPADVGRMRRAGAHAVLVGEAFMERPDPGAALAEWLACP